MEIKYIQKENSVILAIQTKNEEELEKVIKYVQWLENMTEDKKKGDKERD